MKYFLLFISIFTIFPAYTQDSVRVRKESIYYCLDMEKRAGFEVSEENYLLIDTILLMAEKRINPKDTLASGYPKNILNEIHTIIEEVGINGDYSQIDPYKNLLSYSLTNKNFDCDKYSFVFLAIGERLNLPVYGVLLPSHMAIEWVDKKRRFYWETTSKNEYSREKYITDFCLNKYHFSNKMYLTGMSMEDLKFCYLYNRGITYFMLKKYKEAKNDLDSSKILRGIYPFIYEMKLICDNNITIEETSEVLLKEPLNDSARIIRAKAYINLKGENNYLNAINDLNVITLLNSENTEARLWRGVAYMQTFIMGKLSRKNKNYKKALFDFNYVLSMDSVNYQALLYKSVLNRWARDYSASLKDIDIVISLNKNPISYLEKGNLLYNQKKYCEAIELYNKALEIDPEYYEAIQSRAFAKLELEKLDDATEDFFQAYYHGIMPYEYFKKYSKIR
jgi:hypothetical protein